MLLYVDVGKRVLVEIGMVPELAASCNQGRVHMLQTYIKLSFNLAISVIECYQVFFIYIEANS